MKKITWKYNDLKIQYSKPRIQAYKDFKLIDSISDAMYFYYTIRIFDGKKMMFEANTYDFPKVNNLGAYIDYILDVNNEDMYLMEDIENSGFIRQKRYAQAILNDDFNIDSEYFYKIERVDTKIKQSYENEFRNYEYYELTIGKSVANKEGYDNEQPYGKSVFIKYLTRDDLIKLRETARDFCKYAVQIYNTTLKKQKIHCPHCKSVQTGLYSVISHGIDSVRFKCNHCDKKFTNDDDIWN